MGSISARGTQIQQHNGNVSLLHSIFGHSPSTIHLDDNEGEKLHLTDIAMGANQSTNGDRGRNAQQSAGEVKVCYYELLGIGTQATDDE